MDCSDFNLIRDGISYRNEGKNDLALESFDKAIDLQGPNIHLAYFQIGKLFELKFNDVKKATAHYQKAIELKPDFGGAWCCLGNVLCQSNQYEQAKKMYKEALKYLPNDSSALFGLAFALNRLENYSEAIDALETIDVLKKDFDKDNTDKKRLAQIYSELGLAYMYSNQLIKAQEYFKIAFSIDNTDYQACYNLAFIAETFKNYEEAITYYDKAIAINNKEGKAYQGKACSYIHCKKYEEALELIQKAIELSPENFEGYYNLACIQAGLKNENELFNAIKKTLELAPPQIGIVKHIQNDPDFAHYIKQENFISILGQYA